MNWRGRRRGSRTWWGMHVRAGRTGWRHQCLWWQSVAEWQHGGMAAKRDGKAGNINVSGGTNATGDKVGGKACRHGGKAGGNNASGRRGV
eukprot:gene15710-biopygen6700